MESQGYKDKDDGYRGWLKNPQNGRVFKANSVTARRTDFVRISSPFEEARVETSRRAKDIPAQEVVQPRKVEAEDDIQQPGSEAEQAMDDLLEQARASKDKTELKVIGAQLGVKLTSTMNPETMRDRIEKQVEAIKAATR